MDFSTGSIATEGVTVRALRHIKSHRSTLGDCSGLASYSVIMANLSIATPDNQLTICIASVHSLLPIHCTDQRALGNNLKLNRAKCTKVLFASNTNNWTVIVPSASEHTATEGYQDSRHIILRRISCHSAITTAAASGDLHGPCTCYEFDVVMALTTHHYKSFTSIIVVAQLPYTSNVLSDRALAIISTSKRCTCWNLLRWWMYSVEMVTANDDELFQPAVSATTTTCITCDVRVVV